MIVQEHRDLTGGSTGAAFSDDMRYRYRLWRIWDPSRPIVLFVMLNPSKADGRVDDATIRRCRGFASSWGFGGFVVVNMFALVSTDPAALAGHPDPVGSDNDAVILAEAAKAAEVVVAWGANGEALRRAGAVAALVGRPLLCLGISKGGAPLHPLRLRADTARVPWAPSP